MVNHDQPVDRRTVLRSLALGSTLAAGVGTAAGRPSSGSGAVSVRRPTVADVQARFGDVRTVEAVVEEHADALVAALADHGYLDAADAPAVESFVATDEFEATDEDAVATAGPGRIGDREIVDVRVRQQAGAYEVEYHVAPDAGEAYAFVTDADGERVAVRADGTASDVEPSSCASQCSCSSHCTTDPCDCTNGQVWNFFEYESCQVVIGPDGEECLCSWTQTCNDECPGDTVPVCPEPQ